MRVMRVGLLLLTAGLLLPVLSSCGSDSETGACGGFEDGTYYRLEFNNFNTDPIEVKVNGRFVGKVPPAVPKTDGSGGVTPGYNALGEFPICDHTAIGFSSGSGSTFVCATSTLTSDACRQNRADYCWITVLAETPSGIPTGSDAPVLSSPSCAAPPECANSFLSFQSKC